MEKGSSIIAKMTSNESVAAEEHYENNLPIEAFEKIFVTDTADVHFVFKQDGNIEKIPAHKNLLSALSSVFYAMFNGNWQETEEVPITDATAVGFNEFMQFFYKNKVKLTEENVHDVLWLANKYDVDKAITIATRFLVDRLSVKNVLSSFKIAVYCELDELQDICEKYIGINIEKVFKTKEFLQCDLNTLSSIVVIKDLECDEENVFDACIAWAENACEMKNIDKTDVKNLRLQLGDCFNWIGLIGMAKKEFAVRYRIYKDMFTKEEIDNIFLNFLDDY